MRLFKVTITLMLTLAFTLGSFAFADYYGPEYYDYFDGEYYMVTSEYQLGGRYVLPMYQTPSSSGDAITTYENSYVLKVIDYYPEGNQTYCYAIGPDGYAGYVRKAWITNLEQMDGYLPYIVDSDYAERGRYLVYMYSVAGSSGTPIATFYNGEILIMLDPNASSTYSKVMSRDGKVGYVLSRRIKPY